MRENEIRWGVGDDRIRSEVERAAAEAFQDATLLHSSNHRTIHRVFLNEQASDIARTGEGGEASAQRPSVVVKIHRLATGRHPLRDRLKRWLGQSPARREWRALEDAHNAGAPVPVPRAWGRLTNGDEFVVMDFVGGQPLGDAEKNSPDRAELITPIADAITRFHDAGFAHGDLHLGNLILAEKEVVVLDFQRARRRRSPDDRLRDLARLEFSMAKSGWPPIDRRRLRERLDVDTRFDPILRRFLRDHLRGRARRVLRIGRNWSVARVGPLRGLRDVSLDAETLAAIVGQTQHLSPTEERRDGRVQIFELDADSSTTKAGNILVKRIAADSLRRAIGDRLRGGSAAARAFYAGQKNGLLTSHAARPLAFLEERRFGLPFESLLVLEKVGEDDLDRLCMTSPEAQRRLACAVGEWLGEAHAWGLSHRDLKASNIRATLSANSIRLWMIDLEDLIGPTELTDEARLAALVQLNASLADEAMSIEARLASLEAYERRAPFKNKKESPAKTIARKSLARAHRWGNNQGACRVP